MTARPKVPSAPKSDLVPAPVPRRAFLGLAMGASAAWLTGCGDDSPADGGEGATEGSSGSETGDVPSAMTTGGPTGLDDTSGDGSGDESTGGTGDPAECDDDGVLMRFDPLAVRQDDAAFPYAILAGEMQMTSVLLTVQIPDAQPKWLRVWRLAEDEDFIVVVAEFEVVPDEDGYVKVPVDGLCPGTWYQYAYFVGDPDAPDARSPIGEVRTAPEEESLEPLTIAMTACNGSSLDWPALARTADEYYDVFMHLGDMVYADGSTTLEEYRDVWREYLSAEDYRVSLRRSGMFATWDDHEIDDNSNFDRETMDPGQLQKRQNAMDAFFEVLPIEAEGPDYQLWRSFRWGRTAEIIVLDCRYERRPSQEQYISPEQMAFLQDRLLNSPCHFKIVMNSVPITNMPVIWDFAAFDRWEGYINQRGEVLSFIDQNLITNVWFLSGDFHVSFVSRIEPGGTLTSNTYEIAITGGNTNPLPDITTGFSGDQFDYGVTEARGCVLMFDPEANAVNVRFIDPNTGEDLYNETLSQTAGRIGPRPRVPTRRRE